MGGRLLLVQKTGSESLSWGKLGGSARGGGGGGSVPPSVQLAGSK